MEIDAQSTGTVTIRELEICQHDPRMQAYFAALDIRTPDLYPLFQLLDTDDSKHIDMNEFVEGLLRFFGQSIYGNILFD